MTQIITKLRSSVLVATGVIAAGMMGLFGLMLLGSVMFLSLLLLPIGAVAAWAMPKQDDVVEATAEDVTAEQTSEATA